MFLGGVATINHLTYQNINVSTLQMFAGIYRDLQGLCRGFLQYLQGKPCNIYRFSLQYLQIAEIAGKIVKYYRMFPADIAENPCRYCRKPLQSPCKSLQTFAV
jgi:hypothetical protein